MLSESQKPLFVIPTWAWWQREGRSPEARLPAHMAGYVDHISSHVVWITTVTFRRGEGNMKLKRMHASRCIRKRTPNCSNWIVHANSYRISY
jgi:hypothetical protein